MPKYYDSDGGRYFSTTGCVISKDPDTGWTNVRTYRLQLHRSDQIGIWIMPGKHIDLHRQKYLERGEPMPVAVALGVDSVLFLCASAPMPAEGDEYDFAGAIKQQPIDLVQAELSELLVPAGAEMVLEGYLDLRGELVMEGPFGEYSAYYQSASPKPTIKVECITHRDQSIHWGCTTGRPVTDIHMLMALNRTGQVWADLQQMSILGIQAVYCPPETGGYFTAIVSIKQAYPGHSRQVAHALIASSAGMHSTKLVVVVDDDIDPSNFSQVWYAIGMRYQPDRGTDTLQRDRASLVDPSLALSESKIYASRIVIDATLPFEWPENKRPKMIKLNPAVEARVREKWKEFFPDK